MSECPTEEMLSRFYDREGDELETVQDHVRDCPDCSAALDRYHRLDQELQRAVAFRADPKVARAKLLTACLLLLLAGWWWQARPAGESENTYRMSCSDGREYTIKTTGEATLLSLELNDTRAELEPKE